MKKPRSDAKLLQLPEEQQAQLAEWLLGGTPYHQAKALVLAEFGVSTSLGALSSFWSEVCQPALLRRRAKAVETADAVAEAAKARPGSLDAATVDALRQKAFELAISPLSKPDDVAQLFSLVLKAGDQSLKERQVSVSERRVALLEAKLQEVNKAVANAKAGGLTAEALAQIEEAARLL